MAHKINHREIGEGSTLVLLHGYGGSVTHWDSVVEKLKSYHRVVIPNISHLFLSQDKIFFSIQVEVLAKYLKEHFPKQKVHLAGTSYGGALAWALSVQYPELVDRLVLINPMIPHPGKLFLPSELRYFCVTPWTEKGIHMALGTPIGLAVIRKLISAFRDERTGRHGISDNLKGKKLDFVAHLVYRFTWILYNEDWALWENKIRQSLRKPKTMLIYDSEDYLFSVSAYQNFSELYNCEKVHVLSGAGHLAIKIKPDEISQLILQYIESKSDAKVA